MRNLSKHDCAHENERQVLRGSRWDGPHHRIYSNDIDLAAKTATDEESQRIRIRDEAMPDWQQRVTTMLINDVQYTSFDAFVQLEKEFIKYIDAKFDDDHVEEQVVNRSRLRVRRRNKHVDDVKQYEAKKRKIHRR